MRNLKKILALALVFAMALTFTAGAADFTDKAEIGADYVDDVNMLVELGVIAGYPDGSFGPQKNITRAEFAKMAYTLKYGSDRNGDLFAAERSIFTDVQGNANVAWAKGYINYCANQKIVSGVGNNKFNPQGNITVAEATKMILVIMGCDPIKEGFTGASWAANVTAKAIELGVFDGWAGDPTVLATRELVAKLMRNATFAPVYTYSAITGTGSQLNALGTAYNETLGEKTMGLKSVTGIVVANENYYITNDVDAKPFESSKGTALAGIGLANEDESVIFYEYVDEDGDTNGKLLTIDRALGDDMIGNKVNVFFTADTSASNKKDYKNVKVIGDVIVNSDTVVYEVNSLNVDIYPNGDSASNTAIAPYISFVLEDGSEVKVKADADLGKFAKKVDVQNDYLATSDKSKTAKDVLDDFAKYAYVSTEKTSGGNTGWAATVAHNSDFFQDMGQATLSNYRFVSVDGGKTYSYIFKMVNDQNLNKNADYAPVTNYSEAKGTVTISGIGTYDLEDVVIDGTIATDDMVVYYRENGVLHLAKVETLTGAVEAINVDGSVVIGGNTYYSWKRANYNKSGYTTLSAFYNANKAAMGTNTVYYVYGDIVLDLEVGASAVEVSNYAVILNSYYDANLIESYVTLGFADNTKGTYKIGKYSTPKPSTPYDIANDQAQDFANNEYFGAVVQYRILDNGTVDLSAQNFKKFRSLATDQVARYHNNTATYLPSGGTFANAGTEATIAAANTGFDEGLIKVAGKTYYALNDNSVAFVIYGAPKYQSNGAGGYVMNTTASGYQPISFKAYKLVDKAFNRMGSIDAMTLGAGTNLSVPASTFGYVLNTATGVNKSVVAAAMTVVMNGDTGAANDTKNMAYIVAGTQSYNVATDKYYAELTIIDENGLQTLKTVDDVKNAFNVSALEDNYMGKLTKNNYFAGGTFAVYNKNAEGLIDVLDNSEYLSGKLVKANVISETADRLFYFPVNVTNITGVTPSALKFDEDGYDVITIDDGEYVGESIIKAPSRIDSFDGVTANAVLQLDPATNEIVRVFSFVEGY